MIRTVLASPWLPLLYWTAAVCAMIYRVHQVSLDRRLSRHEFQMVGSAPISTTSPSRSDFSTLEPRPVEQGSPIGYQPTRVWSPQISVFQRPDSLIQRHLTEIVINRPPILPEPRTSASAPITMLSIRVDPVDQPTAKTLMIRCRTSAPIRSAPGRIVTIQGVVTQEVVSSAGKILILAGSRVLGSGLLDPENGRIKSDGRWAVFLDDTELKVQAELLDRPSGLPGILGHETSNEDETLQKEPVLREGRSVFVPRNAPFVLELRGAILLRDLKTNEVSN